MTFFNIRNQIKLLLKVKVNNDMTIDFSKLSSSLSQYGIEEANLIDFYVSNFFKNISLKKLIKFDSAFSSISIFIPLQLIIFRDDLETVIKIFFFDQKFLVKHLLDKNLKFTKFTIFLLTVLSQKRNFYKNYFSLLFSFKGFYFSFKNRDLLKARKINFRRKLKKDTYND